jgi:hypothetical protein
MDRRMQKELDNAVVNFETFRSNSAFRITGRGILSIKDISDKFKTNTTLILE